MGKDAEFLDAARTGNIQVVEKVLNSKARRSGPLASLRRGPGANVQDSSGYTALHHAALNGHRSVVSLLLRHEASVNVQDDKGSTPLHLAAWAGHDHVIKVLLTQGPSVPHINHQNKGGDTALHFAAQYGHTETTRLLLKRGGDPTLPNLKAETPLDLAAQFGRLAIAELLLREARDLLRPFVADAATAAVFPHTPLHLASRNGHLCVVKLLLSQGHHVNVRTSLGSPLHEAAICGKVDVVRALMEAGADSEVKNDLGHTVLDTISSIKTPVTQEISGLIKSNHARLIDLDDVPPYLGLGPEDQEEEGVCAPSASDKGGPAGRDSVPPSPSSSVTTLPSFEFHMPASVLRQSSSPTPSVPILRPSPPSGRASTQPSSAPSNTASMCRTPVRMLRSDSLRSASSSSSSPPPPVPPSLPPGSEWGQAYENVLIPTKLYPTDGDAPHRTSDRRSNSRGSADRKDYGCGGGRISGRESRLSDKEASGRLSDREGRLSDYDGRASVASEYSIYDVPPPPKMTSASDRSSVSTRSSSAHEILDDDGTYEIPPPPRPFPPSLRGSKDLSDGESSKPHPPPKPPRRSVCPPSPVLNADGTEDRSYEMICFATSGHPDRKSDYENSDPMKNLRPLGSSARPTSEIHYKTLGSSSLRGPRKYGHCSSDSDSDSGRPHRNSSTFFNNKGYTTMSFKPVKSRRTTKTQNSYENTIHRYENIHSLHQRKRQSHHSFHAPFHAPANNNNNDNNNGGAPSPPNGLSQRPHQNVVAWRAPSSPRMPPHPERARSAHGDARKLRRRGSDPSSEDSEGGGGRPRSLDFVLDDAAKETPQKRSSRDIETETDPEDTAHVEVRSTGVGSTPPPATEDEGPAGVVAGGGGGSSCSLSSASAASLSDRSASTDNIEEVRSDVPFAGLFRGSRISAEWPCGPEGRVMALERPRSLTSPASAFRAFDRGCRSSYPSVKVCGLTRSANNCAAPSNHSKEAGEKGGGVLSPLEEDEEWAQISTIMASFGGGVARESFFMEELEQEFQQRLGMSLSPSQQKMGFLSKKSPPGVPGAIDAAVSPSKESDVSMDVGTWLLKQELGQYEATFLAHGYDDINFMNGLLDHSELEEMGVSDASHRERLLEAVSSFPPVMPNLPSLCRTIDTLEEWLAAIHLPQYVKVFRKHGFGEMERVRKIWEVELSVVLEVSLQGHRKRMLASLGDRPIEPELPASLAPQELSLELSKLNTDISELKEKLFHELPFSTSRERRPPETATNTIRRGTTKRRAAPPPPPKAPRAQPSIDKGDDQGSPNPPSPLSMKQLSLRNPSQLVMGVPHTLITEWKHHPTKLVTAHVQYLAQYLGSAHVKEVKGTESTMKSIQKLRKSTADGAKVPNILLAVSYLGVRFIDAATQHVVCEHEIRNIHCACQDADDLCHFAYITKDIETQGHYCHVFRVQSRDLATEIIMTLGEAFEVAYQLTLREQHLLSNQSDEQKLAQGHSRSKSEHVRSAKDTVPNGGAHVRSLSSVSNQFLPKGVTAPNSSQENLLLSDSGNFSDRDPDTPSCRRESSSPSVDSSSNSGSMCPPQNNDAT